MHYFDLAIILAYLIAITIFGDKKVAEEWYGSSQYLKDRIRRLVAKGTELMNGGYRDLLL